MTAVADVKTILETFKGGTLTNEQITKFSQPFIDADPTGLLMAVDENGDPTYYADPLNPTNEELAGLAFAGMKWALKQFGREQTYNTNRAIKEAELQAEMDAQVADLD